MNQPSNHSQLPFIIEFLGTPEAGKTTTIHRLEAELSKNYSTSIIRESAEITPDVFPKRSLGAHLWMKFTTYRNILEKQYSSNTDILLVDRGIIDNQFWDYYYCAIGKLDPEKVTIYNTFSQNIGIRNPNLVVFLSTSPEESIQRRGGEGRIVTLDFVKQFNNLLNCFMSAISVSIPVFHLDTTGLSEDTVLAMILKELPLP